MPAMTLDLADDLRIEQGAYYTCPLELSDGDDTPLDLTGYTARMQVRKSVGSSEVLLELTTANGRLVIEGSTVRIVLSAEVTAAITWRQGVYDLELVPPDGKVERLVQGSVVVSPEVTRG